MEIRRGKDTFAITIAVSICEPNTARMIRNEAENNGYVRAERHAYPSAVGCPDCK